MLSENSAFMNPEPPDRETTSKNKAAESVGGGKTISLTLSLTTRTKKRTILIKLTVSQLNSWSGKWFDKKHFTPGRHGGQTSPNRQPSCKSVHHFYKLVPACVSRFGFHLLFCTWLCYPSITDITQTDFKQRQTSIHMNKKSSISVDLLWSSVNILVCKISEDSEKSLSQLSRWSKASTGIKHCNLMLLKTFPDIFLRCTVHLHHW